MKHDHKKTKKLKIALFAMTMFLPFIAIGVTSATHIFNKEVAEETQTATINYKYETETPQANANLKDNYLYTCTLNDNQIQNIATYFLLITKITTNEIILKYSVENIQNEYIWIENDANTISIEYWLNNETNKIIAYIDNDNQYNLTWLYNEDIHEQEGTTHTNIYNFFETPQELIPIESVTITTNPTDQTTNIFYDSCEQVKQSFVLNWCSNQNPLRNTIQNFTNIIALPNNHLLNDLLTYWLSITLIYVVIDIIIEIFIYITHLFNKEV